MNKNVQPDDHRLMLTEWTDAIRNMDQSAELYTSSTALGTRLQTDYTDLYKHWILLTEPLLQDSTQARNLLGAIVGDFQSLLEDPFASSLPQIGNTVAKNTSVHELDGYSMPTS